MGNDERFHRLNNLDENKYSLIVKSIGLVGFTTLERINKLVPYDETEKINEEVQKYSKLVDELLEEVEKAHKGLQPDTSNE